MELAAHLETIGLEADDLNEEQTTLIQKSLDVLNELEKERDTALSDVTHQKEEAKKAFEKRDDLKIEIRELKTKLADGSQNQDLKPQLEEAEKKLTDLEELNTALTAKHDLVQTTLTDIREERRNGLIKQLPEGSKERTFAESISLENHKQLNEFVEIAAKKISTDDGHTGGFKIDETKGYNDYSTAELDKLKEKNEAHYVKIYRKRYGRNPL